MIDNSVLTQDITVMLQGIPHSQESSATTNWTQCFVVLKREEKEVWCYDRGIRIGRKKKMIKIYCMKLPRSI